MTSEPEIDALRQRIEEVRRKIASACDRAGRRAEDVRLLPVSKTVPAARLRAAVAAGLTAFGENKVQEAKDKSEALADLPLRWSVIGHLQTNKAKYVARFAHEFQALDSLRVAEALDRRLQIEGRSLDVFIQVNSSGETSKFGLSPDEVPSFAQSLTAFHSLNVRGLMTLAILASDMSRVRSCFRRMTDLQERLRDSASPRLSFDELSMGMSGDYEIAVEHGATVVRIGQAIFGARALPDSYYWPEPVRP